MIRHLILGIVVGILLVSLCSESNEYTSANRGKRMAKSARHVQRSRKPRVERG